VGAWANGRPGLDFLDTFLAADYAPGGHPPLLAVAQQKGADGARLLAAIAAAYEVHVSLVKGISLHAQKKDHVAHLAPAIAAGLGTLLGLETAVVYHAINQAVHLGFSTRQSRKGEITSWKASAPAWAGKLAIEAVDRAMRGEGAPNPIYEGEDGVIAWMLAGPDAEYAVPLPAPGERPRGILETYPKAHSAEYQAQALIDLAFDLRRRIAAEVWPRVREVVVRTSHHTHTVIGSGSNDPEKYDPGAYRETLYHSVMYILAVALEDGRWHHVDSYLPARADVPPPSPSGGRSDRKTPSGRRGTRSDPARKAFGGRVDVARRRHRRERGAPRRGRARTAGALAMAGLPESSAAGDGRPRCPRAAGRPRGAPRAALGGGGSPAQPAAAGGRCPAGPPGRARDLLAPNARRRQAARPASRVRSNEAHGTPANVSGLSHGGQRRISPMRKRTLALLTLAALVPLVALAAEPIKLMVPANPGGGWDATGAPSSRRSRPRASTRPARRSRTRAGQAARSASRSS
jgi:hypothetical protein